MFGFINDSFTGKEQGEGHRVQVGYRKGADIGQKNLRFSVWDTAGTACESSVWVLQKWIYSYLASVILTALF